MYPVFTLHESLGYRLSLAARAQERRLENGLRTLGLTRVTWYVLLAAGREDLSQPSDIAEFVRIDRTAASRALRQMESAGLIRREAGEDDRRTTRVRLTDTGRATLEQAVGLAADAERELAERLGPERREDLARALQPLVDGQDGPLDQT